MEFTLTSDTNVAIDVLSVEIADNDTYYDLNGDCHAGYLDSMLFLFSSDDSTPLFTVDDSDVDEGTDDGSVSYRDPYKLTYLKKGSYTLVIAPTGSSEEDARAGKTKADYPPELYTEALTAPTDWRFRARLGTTRFGLRSYRPP